MQIELPKPPFPGLLRIASDFSVPLAVNGFIAFIFTATAPVAIVLSVGASGGLSEAEMVSWIFAAFFTGGVISIIFCTLYRQPLVFFWTIPGTVLIGPALDNLSFAEVIGAFYATGALMLILGLSGWVKRITSALPMPIVMAMVAGVFLQFGLNWLRAFETGFWIAAPMTLVFFGLGAYPALARRFPPLISALVAGLIAMPLSQGGFAGDADLTLRIADPIYFAPTFSLAAMFELVVPLAITVLAAQNAQGYAVISVKGHEPPVNAVTAICGVGGLVNAAFGAVSTCLTGPVNAVISSSGPKERHYTAGIFVGILGITYGLFSPVFTSFMLATPKAFIATLAGIALLGVLQTAFRTAFQGRFTYGALITFLVTAADISIFGIGAPFWALVFGFATSWLLEREDFRAAED
ncbi:MAG: benzoate transporter [Rhodospirillaceae bacterium]|jgi:benzoate membrane transport protein|nr:benzoate transporter [Rhodospirillaceae bacterium]MBT5179242.1 benzoate transporter [Rhodospirillaceae bacterium]